MIEPAAISFLHFMLGSLGSGLDVYVPEALAEYERCFADPAAIRGMCEDYRAAGSIDLVHYAEDRNRLIRCPVLLLWGWRGIVGTLYDPIKIWRDYATDVRGQALDAGHFLADERPLETLAALRAFLDPRE
jgi:haloacetate dehalogenase